jgi:TRAP-type C4-dicarboxylate transport system permease small subunit
MNALRKYFYLTSAFLSGACLVLMTLLITAQIFARFVGVVIPSSEDFAGWLLSATIFFGLAYTFHEGGHIRVTMLLVRIGESKRRYLEFFNLVVGLLISGFLALYTAHTVYESYDFGDVTDTYLVVPLWMVQMPMAIGSLFLFVTMLDSFAEMITGKTPRYIVNEDILSEEI